MSNERIQIIISQSLSVLTDVCSSAKPGCHKRLLPDSSIGMKESESEIKCIGNCMAIYFLINLCYESDNLVTRQAQSDRQKSVQ